MMGLGVFFGVTFCQFLRNCFVKRPLAASCKRASLRNRFALIEVTRTRSRAVGCRDSGGRLGSRGTGCARHGLHATRQSGCPAQCGVSPSGQGSSEPGKGPAADAAGNSARGLNSTARWRSLFPAWPGQVAMCTWWCGDNVPQDVMARPRFFTRS